MQGTFGGRRLRAPIWAIAAVAALAAAILAALLAGGPDRSPEPAQAQASAAGAGGTRPPAVREILAVSNNWDGTMDIVDPHTFKRLKRINIAPDFDQRFLEITSSPDEAAFFFAIRNQIGEGHDQLADDGFTSPDGRFIYVSRPSFKDVVAISLKTGKILWRTEVAGYRSDHMAISRNGKRLLVSASTGNVVHVIQTATGKIIGEFESGDSPHENNFSRDGKRIYHASIGRVYTPTDMKEFDTSKGEQYFQIVDARTYKIIKRLEMDEVLAKAGYPGMSAAVRPMTLSPDERFVYFQVSFFHGYIEYDLKRHRVRRVINLPVSQEAQQIRREDYLLDSAHHGIALNPKGTLLCVAGTMSDYAAIVSRRTGAYKLIRFGSGAKPYWSTESEDGKYCFVSISGQDRVSVISFKKRKQVASIPVGDHPQRMRTGFIRRAYLR